MNNNTNFVTVTFADTFTKGYDNFGNKAVYANVYINDDHSHVVKLAVADDNREQTKSARATELCDKLTAIGNIRGKQIAISNPYFKKAGYTTFMNATSRSRIVWPANGENEGKVYVAGYYRSAPKK